MKEKIENLIKEIGVNEVEVVLNQMKSKVNIKQELKKDFIELLNDCTISFYDNDINYKKNGQTLFTYQKNNNYFRIRYDICLELEFKYNVNYDDLCDLLVGVVEDVLNYKGVTVFRFWGNVIASVEDVLLNI